MDNKSEQTQPETNETPQESTTPITSVEDKKSDEKCETKADVKITADLDSSQGEDKADKEIITINEPITAQELIKNSEESKEENSEKSESPVLMKQIKVDEQPVQESQEKNEDINEQNNLEDYDEEEASDDAEETIETNEKIVEIQNVVESSVLEEEILVESSVVQETPKKTDDLPVNNSPAQIKQDRRLSRQTSSNSNNSASPSVEPALVPIKKGNFYEHDNRDDEETEKTETPNETKQEPKITPKKKSIDNKKLDLQNMKSSKLEQSTSGSQEILSSERWGHDMFEKQQNEPTKQRENKPIEKRGQFREKRLNNRTEKPKINEQVNRESFNDEAPIQTFQETTVEQASLNQPRQKFNNRPKPVNKLKEENLSQTVIQPEAAKQEPIKETAQKSKSKGLALSEYLEQNGDNQPKQLAESNDVKPKTNNRRPNMPTYQPQQRPYTNNDRNNGALRENKPVSNQQDNRNLKNRLDFSTRKPINSNNFENELENGSNRVRTSNDTFNQLGDDKNSKYNLKITTNFNSSTRIVQEEPVPLKIDLDMNLNFNNNNNSRPYSNRKYQSRTNENQSQSNFNYNTKSNETYDEYFVQEEDNSKLKKPFDRSRLGDKQQNFDANNDLNRNIKPKMNQNMIQTDPAVANNNFTAYSDYAVYDQHYSNQQLHNPNNIQVKSQSYSNSSYRNNSNRTEQPQDFQRKQQHFYQQQQQQQQQSGFGPVFNTNNRPINNNRPNYESSNMQHQVHETHVNYIPNDNNFNIRKNQFQQNF